MVGRLLGSILVLPWAVAPIGAQDRPEAAAAQVEADLLAQARDTSGAVRAQAMARMDRLSAPSDRIVAALIRGTRDPVCDVWERAVYALADLATRRGVLDALERASRRWGGATLEPQQDPRDWTSCYSAIESTIEALAQLPQTLPPRALSQADRALARLFEDPNPFVRDLALRHVPSPAGPALRAALQKALWDTEPGLRADAIWWVRKQDTTSTEIRARLAELAGDSLRRIREAAMNALPAYGPEGKAAVQRFLASPRREVRIAAAVVAHRGTFPDSLQARLSDLAGCGAARIVGGPRVFPDSLAGTYRLVMVGAGPVRDAFEPAAQEVDSVVAGQMELWVQDTLHRWGHDRAGQRVPSTGSYSPLGGATDLDVARLGINSLGRPLSQRGDNPGIRTYVRLPEGVATDGFSLRFGEIGGIFDAPWLRLMVWSASEAGFRGTWVYGLGYPDDRWYGLFCAVRLPE